MERYDFPSSRVYLRPLQPEDINDRYVSWFADDTVTMWLEAKRITKKDALDYLEEGRRTKRWFNYAVCDKTNDRHIGNVKVGPINYRHMTSDLVTVIGERDYWGKGIASEAISIGNRVAFEVYRIRKLNGGMYESNKGSTKAYCKGGWFVETHLPRHYQIGDHLEDRVVVSCLNPKFYPVVALQQGEPPATVERGAVSFRLVENSSYTLPPGLGGRTYPSATYQFHDGSNNARIRIITGDNPYRIYADLSGDPPREIARKMISAMGDCFEIQSISIIAPGSDLDLPDAEQFMVGGTAVLRSFFRR